MLLFYPQSSTAVTPLSGVFATGAVGIFSLTATSQAVGILVSTSAGSTPPATGVAATGSSAPTSAGSTPPATGVGLPGTVASGASGVVLTSSGSTVALIGIAASALVGSLSIYLDTGTVGTVSNTSVSMVAPASLLATPAVTVISSVNSVTPISPPSTVNAASGISRLALIEYYTQAWAKPTPKAVYLVEDSEPEVKDFQPKVDKLSPVTQNLKLKVFEAEAHAQTKQLLQSYSQPGKLAQQKLNLLKLAQDKVTENEEDEELMLFSASL